MTDNRAKIQLAVLLLIATVILSCSGATEPNGLVPTGAANPAAAATPADQQLADALVELDGLAVLPGTDPMIQEQLKSMLQSTLPAMGRERFIAAAPVSPASRVTDLRIWNNGDGTAGCRWTYRNEGDYNQDSQVTASDITPLGRYWARSSSAADWVRAALADGSNDGMITAADITPIGRQYGKAVEGYILEVTATPAVETSWEEVTRIPFSAGLLPDAGGRCWFTWQLATPQPGQSYRATPYQNSTAGVAGVACEYDGELAPAFEVSGVCLDGYGMPLAGVQLELAGLAPQFSGGDGGFSFTGIADGFSAALAPAMNGLLFLPEEYIVSINNASFTGLEFTGLAVAGLECTLPPTAGAGEDFAIELQVVDAAGLSVAGYTADAMLHSSPPGIIRETPRFIDGVAQVTARFPEPGEFEVSLSGLHDSLNGYLGTIEITADDPPVLTVAKWRGNAEAAISLTFDDGTADHWSRGLPLWEEYGFHVTLGILQCNFELEPERIGQLQQAFDAGHEIANHTATHIDLTTLTPAGIAGELQSCADFLKANINGLERIDTVIYPYEQFNATVLEVVQQQGYLFARSGYQGISDHAELNNAWSPPFHHLYSWANQDILPVAMWNSTTDWAVRHGDWLVEQCHGIGRAGESGVGWSPRPESEFRAHYDHIKSFGSRVWVAPVSEVGCYLIERNNAGFEILEYTGGRLDFIVFDALDNEAFNVPLTIRLELPAGWQAVTVSQGIATVPHLILKNTLQFDVQPGGGIVSITAG